MKIAVDCHPLKKNKAGVGHYLYSLLSELVQIRSDDQFYLYASQGSLELETLSKNKNVTLKIYPLFHQSSIIWGQITLPLAILKDDADLLWSTNHLAPVLLPKKVKNLILVHDFVYKIAPKTVKIIRRLALNIITNLTFDQSRFFISNSNGTKEKLKNYYNINSNSVINPPVRKNFFHISDELFTDFLNRNHLENKKYFLFVGTLEPRKNLESILLTYEKAIELYGLDNCYPLIIIGGKGWKNTKAIDKLNYLLMKYPQNIIVKGYVSEEELPYYFKGARYFLFPSLYEGYGMPVAEARSIGTAVITSNIPELIEASESDGIFLNPYNLENELFEYFQIDKMSSIPNLSKKITYLSNRNLSKHLSNCFEEILLK